MRKKLVAGNWKMHGALQKNEALLKGIRSGLAGLGSEFAVCAPFPYLHQLGVLLGGSSVAWGAQTVSEYDFGAYTGEVSASMLAEFGCRYVLVGHSERRSLFGESDAVVAAKFDAAKRSGLVPVLCLGETLLERERGETTNVIFRQLDAVIDRFGVAVLVGAVLAYEPVWAIGTGVTAFPEQAQEVHLAIREHIRALSVELADEIQIIYGGSVKPGSAIELFAQPDIDGGLIGGAALDLGDFLAICRAAG
jgi:triosephosphate isomerase